MMASEGSAGQISVDSVDISDYDKYQDITHYKQSSHTVNIDSAGEPRLVLSPLTVLMISRPEESISYQYLFRLPLHTSQEKT